MILLDAVLFVLLSFVIDTFLDSGNPLQEIGTQCCVELRSRL